MAIRKFLDRGTFDAHKIQIIIPAFEKALRLADVNDRTSLVAQLIARRVFAEFEKGEVDPKRIARLVIGAKAGDCLHS
jgi:hypothetical protein